MTPTGAPGFRLAARPRSRQAPLARDRWYTKAVALLAPLLCAQLAAQAATPVDAPALVTHPTAPSPDAPAAAVPTAATAPALATPRGLEARLRVLGDQIALALKRLPGDHRDQRFALAPFASVGDEAQARQLGLVVSDALVTALARDHRLPMVERAALGKILDEQALGQSGALDDGQAAAVGKLAGATALVVGTVAEAGDAFLVTVRALDVESAALIDGSAASAELPKGELVALSAEAVVLKSKAGAMFRSVVLPGWGQLYNGEPIKAAVVGGGVGTMAALGVTAGAIGGWLRYMRYPSIGTTADDKKLSAAELQARVVETRGWGEGTLIAAGVLGGLTVTAWGAGVVDAYLAGTDVESLDAALAGN